MKKITRGIMNDFRSRRMGVFDISFVFEIKSFGFPVYIIKIIHK